MQVSRWFGSLFIVVAVAHAGRGSRQDWRSVLEGFDGYPAGNMLEIAVRRTHSTPEEMFKWRSEFISLLGAYPGPLVEREWKSISSTPPIDGSGTWTGMTWWENQQRWHDMANVVFPTPVTQNWLRTINMTLCHVRPMDPDFDLRTLAQSGMEVLELGILAYPRRAWRRFEWALNRYLHRISRAGAETYRFDFFSNGQIEGPLTVAYLANDMPDAEADEEWFVYMAVYDSLSARDMVQKRRIVANALERLKAATVEEHSDYQVMERSTSKVCCTKDKQCKLDPEVCQVSVLGLGDTWASNCAQCPKPCRMDYAVCSLLASQTCLDVGGEVVSEC